MRWDGFLMTSFQLMGGIHFSLDLSGYPDVGETNSFLERLKGRHVLVTIKEAQLER